MLTAAFAGSGKRGGGARRGAEEARRGPPLTRDDASEDELEAAVEVPAAVSEGGRTRGGAGREGLRCEAPIRPELAARPWQGGCAREREAEVAARKAERDLRSDGVRAVPCGGTGGG